ncbi:UbiA family prenyltransferase [Aeoliella sp. SH292]|uniref:UbiA family prenyltransferase n=1 Tax=Aeoliella sp. SH292 TaxID=3454464 RepID=UPI003F972E99
MAAFQQIRAYAELMRVANVFTAVSNVWMGMILATGELPGWIAVGVTAVSVLLYLAGMVLNDVFDAEVDRNERPGRPIPSGRISVGAARALGWALLIAGAGLGWAISRQTPTAAPGVISWWLAGFILAYDVGLKRTALGPMLMGACRFANVLLGLSVASEAVRWGALPIDQNLTPAIGMAIYVWGVSWFARSEATQSRPYILTVAAFGSMLGLGLIASMPFSDPAARAELVIQPWGWGILWLVVAGLILRRMVVAILQPSPKYVQRAVGNAILSIIVIDAAICLGFASPFWACAVLALLAPAMLLAQLFKVT